MAERYLIAGPIRLDLHDARVWRDEAPVRLGGKAFELLHALMDNPQVLVTKDALFERVWNGLAVSDSVLTTAVKELRQALDDDAREPMFIETVHRRGYRFLLPVDADDRHARQPAKIETPVSAPDAAQPARRPWIAGGAFAAIVAALLWFFVPMQGRDPVAAVGQIIAHPKSIAVMPFRDLSANMEQNWFAAGLTEEVLSRLTRTPDLHVASRVSVEQLRKTNGTMPDMARLLGVAHILDGSVRRSNGRVRVTAELVRASDGFQLWSQTYDRPASDVISIQEDIAFRIASAMKTVMEPSRLRAMVAAGTRSVEAYEAYLQGVAEDQRSLDTGGRAHVLAAAAAYERARMLDQNFAAAHWRAAQNWFGGATRINGSISGDRLSDAEALKQFMTRVDQAILTSKDETESLKYRSARALMQMEPRQAHRLLVSYLQARPRDIDAWEDMAERAAYAGERGWLARAAERIHTLSIEGGEPRSRAITVSAMALKLDDAVARAREQIALRPESIMVRYQAHRAFIWTGNTADARRSLALIQSSDLPEENKLLAGLRQACAEGRRSDAVELQQRLIGSGASLSGRWQAAQMLGETAAARALLQPLDRADRLTTLMQFMINPSFDAGLYPVLSATLARSGVTPPKPFSVPRACPGTRSG
jgi:TolB-like protein/DNA-binding winged helix-turn-helix (wHTH) protein